MNSFIVKLFVFLTEVLSGIIIGLVILAGLIAMAKMNFFAGLAITVVGTILVVGFFGMAAIFIEIHKDIRAMKEIAEKNRSNDHTMSNL